MNLRATSNWKHASMCLLQYSAYFSLSCINSTTLSVAVIATLSVWQYSDLYILAYKSCMQFTLSAMWLVQLVNPANEIYSQWHCISEARPEGRGLTHQTRLCGCTMKWVIVLYIVQCGGVHVPICFCAVLPLTPLSNAQFTHTGSASTLSVCVPRLPPPFFCPNCNLKLWYGVLACQ